MNYASNISSKFLAKSIVGVVALVAIAMPQKASAQAGPIEVEDSNPVAAPTPKKGSVVGRRAAEKYMAPHKAEDEGGRETIGSQLSSSDHYLAVHIGGYVSDNSYRWGLPDNQKDIGDATVGVTYRLGEWQHAMDLALRVDYSAYGLQDGTAGKLSFVPMITFPDASSKFPLYLGAGIGLGIFTKQVSSESALAFDYQLVLGARFFEVIGNAGFFIEAGIKNHILILSDGQFNGTFVAVGPVFTF